MAYITNDDVKAIRNELKALKKEFGKSLKFSVRKENYSKVSINVMQWDEDLSDLLNEYGYGGVNHYYIRDHHGDSRLTDMLEKVNEIAHNAPGRAGGQVFFDNSDPMTDYFHTAYYVGIGIGKWDKPYINVNETITVAA